MKCLKCGCKLTKNSGFCTNCGNEINIEEIKKHEKQQRAKLLKKLSLLLCVICFAIYLTFNIAGYVKIQNALNNPNGYGVLLEMSKPLKSSNKWLYVSDLSEILKSNYNNNLEIKYVIGNKIIIHSTNEINLQDIPTLIEKVQPIVEFKKIDKNTQKWITTNVNSKDIKRAYPISNTNGDWVVSLEFDNNGKEKFAQLTQSLIDQPLGIFYQNEIISAPIIKEPITGGNAQISAGNNGFSYEESLTLANIINSSMRYKVLKTR